MTPQITLQNLTTPLSSTVIRQMLVKALVGVGIPANLWLPGGIASSLLTFTATILSLVSSAVATAISGFFLPLASGQMLQLLAFYVYGVTVPQATFATGNLTLTNSGGGVYNIGIGGYVASNGTFQYTNTAAFVLNGSTTISVPMQCTTLGSVGSSAPGTITKQVTNLLGVTCTNPMSFAGVDVPPDSAIRQLCLNALGALSVRGPRTAYGFAVQTAVNPITNSPVNVNRWTVSISSHTGNVTVYIASPAGPVDPNDLQGVVNNIEAVARPNAVTATVIGASVLPDNDIYTVYCTAPTGVTAAQIQAGIQNALIVFFQNYVIGGVAAADNSGSFQGLFATGVAGAIGQAVTSVGGQMISVQGANDYSMGASNVMGDNTTVNVRIVALPNGTTVGI